jgi:anthranilate 1,2-dioxygenase large subunit/terephthalate 1,2-dioxygenase oxygenase component alpha subunit
MHDTAEAPLEWPIEGISRVPYRVYSDPALYERELAELFRGDIWQFVGFDVEVPKVGDFKTTWIGDMPVMLLRSGDDAFSVLVNRCAHRGAAMVFEPSGHRRRLTCVYHNWSYDLEGRLSSVAFQAGVRGVGGMPEDFDPTRHNMQRLRVERLCGLVFASFSEKVPPLETYLGERMTAHLRRMFARPVHVLGSYSQVLHNNWKLYMENVKDSYHASLLHTFLTTFKLNRLSMEGGLALDDSGGHHISYSMMTTDQVQGTDYESGRIRAQNDDFSLRDPRVLDSWPEFDDGVTHAIQSLFPNMVVQQIQNSLAVRVLVPRGVDTCELFWTLFGYTDDTPEETRTRVRLANLIGPAGLVSMEDGVVGNFVQRTIGARPSGNTVLEMGGRTAESQKSRVSEASVRGFWQRYRQHLGL